LTEIHALGGKYPRERNWLAIRRYERPRLAAEYAQVIREASLSQAQTEFAKVRVAVDRDREADRTLSRPA
jgi:hypothetical protein